MRRRDRHGRGLRGPLVPAPLPGALSRSEAFEELLAESVNRLQELWGPALNGVEFIIDEIPEDLEELATLQRPVPLASLRAEPSSRRATVTVYRRPALQRAFDDEDLAELVHHAVVNQIAGFLNIPPERVEPRYGGEGELE